MARTLGDTFSEVQRPCNQRFRSQNGVKCPPVPTLKRGDEIRKYMKIIIIMDLFFIHVLRGHFWGHLAAGRAIVLSTGVTD